MTYMPQQSTSSAESIVDRVLRAPALPYIDVFCICGKKLYSVSLNVVGIHSDIKCQCGLEYACEGTLIPRPIGEAFLLMQEASQSTHNPSDHQP